MKATHQEKSATRSGPLLSVPKKVRHSAAVIEIDVDQKATMDACFLRETIGAIIGRGVGRAIAAKAGAANDAIGN